MHLNKIVQGIKFAKSYLIKLGMPAKKKKIKKKKNEEIIKRKKNSFQECIRS